MKNKWTPVHDKLPKDGRYIVTAAVRKTDDDGQQYGRPHYKVKIANYNQATGKWTNDYGGEVMYITAWMDLPGAYGAPKGQDNEP